MWRYGVHGHQHLDCHCHAKLLHANIFPFLSNRFFYIEAKVRIRWKSGHVLVAGPGDQTTSSEEAPKNGSWRWVHPCPKRAVETERAMWMEAVRCDPHGQEDIEKVSQRPDPNRWRAEPTHSWPKFSLEM
jgi:hypothetical protein